jgi:uncharacterized membrane protein YhaH (DUF805 family)
MDFWKFYLSPNGRVCRRDYWFRMALPFWVITLGARFADRALGWQIQDAEDPEPIGIAESIASLLLLWPNLAVIVKRLHDTNKTGWWVMIAPLLFAVCAGIVILVGGGGTTDATASIPLIALVVIAALGALYVLGVQPGDAHANRFGADPLNPGGDEAEQF